ncbi:hypothetical protein ABLO02_01790, partial [Mycobacterium tuberculosis]
AKNPDGGRAMVSDGWVCTRAGSARRMAQHITDGGLLVEQAVGKQDDDQRVGPSLGDLEAGGTTVDPARAAINTPFAGRRLVMSNESSRRALAGHAA